MSFKKSIKALTIFALAGIIYLIFINVTGITVPCIFQKITGWHCPGCGITTLFYRLSKGNIKGAYLANRFIFVTSPFIIFEVIYCEYLKYREKKSPFINNLLLYIYIAALIIWGIARNIIGDVRFTLFDNISDIVTTVLKFIIPD